MKRPTAIGVFIFAGGFSVGVKRHFDVLAHLEGGSYGVETAIKNRVVPVAHIEPGLWPLEKYKGVDFVYSNPPCAPWSSCSHGRSTHWTEDPRLDCVKRAYGVFEALQPKAWAWESVRPVWVKGRELVESVARKAMGAGYSATVLMVDGVNHGVPQVRRRFILVLHKYAIEWEPTGIKKTATVAEAFAKGFATQTVAPASPQYLKLLKAAKPGERLTKVYNRMYAARVALRKDGERMKGRPSFQNLRLVADEPSCVLTGGAKQYHPTKDRLISVEESAALCGYPRSFKFYGAIGKQYAQVAQAVMPPVGEYLGRMVAQSLKLKRKISKPYFSEVWIHRDRVDQQLLMLHGGAMDLRLKARPVPEKKPRRMGTVATSQTTPRAPRLGSGFRIRQMLVEGKDHEAILKQIHKEFPQSKATKSDVYWNRQRLKQQGGAP